MTTRPTVSFFLIVCTLAFADTGYLKLLPPPKNKIYFGAFPDFGGPEDNVTAQRIREFENIAGKKIAWAYFSQNWFNGIVYPKEAVHTIHSCGSVPFIRLMPRSDESQGHAEEHFSLINIINGKFDDDLRKWAQDAKEDNIPLLLDFAVEANGDWFPWSGALNGGGTTDEYGDPSYPDGPEKFRDAYRHIITLFREEGVKHVTWFFHFNYTSFPEESWNRPKYYYPGDSYIDWIGFSLYGAQTLDEPWDELLFSTQLKEYKNGLEELDTRKPIALLEFGVTDHHPDGNKSAWIEDAMRTVLNNPYVTFNAVAPWHENWVNEDESNSTLRLDSSPEAEETFKRWIARDEFQSTLIFGTPTDSLLPTLYPLLF
jgi:hypothetical protein